MGFLNFLFGSGRNVIAQTAEVFRPNAEKSAQRAATHASAALAQYAAEFHHREDRTWIDSFADALNRLVRPTVTIGLIFPIPATIYAPDRMADVWVAIATLPPGYWAIVGIVLPFYFGGRMQVKALASTNWRVAEGARAQRPGDQTPQAGENPALEDWRANTSD